MERLRQRMAEIPARSAGPVRPSLAALTCTDAQSESGEVELDALKRVEPSPIRALPVPPPIADLLPHRGLARGSTIRVDGVASLRAGLIATVTAAGGWAAVVGSPDLGLLAAAEMGADLSRCAVIEEPGPDPVAVAAVLVDGIDLILVSLAGADVPPSRARAVTARARRNGAVLAFTGGRWPATDVHLDARVAGYRGLEPGYGRITGIDLDVQVTTRGGHPRHRTVTLSGRGGHVDWIQATDDSGAIAPLRMAR
ncbi:hypothetical protein CA951_03155 [Rhodococcus sp. NCIMB 12038]|nr:hypothetical protein CA951_03155 [Rhodococcus sp. NCIMB 12038]